MPDIQRCNTQNVLRGALYVGCSILMLCEMDCRCSSVTGLARRQQDLAEESGQFAEPVQWQDFGDILVGPNDN